MTTSTALRRLWRIAPIQSTNLIEKRCIDESFNKSLTAAAINSFDQFASTKNTSSARTGVDKGPQNATTNGRKRRRRNVVKSINDSSSSQHLNQKYTIDSKTGLTTNDYFFEHQRINGYSQQTMSIPQMKQLEELLSLEVQTYLSSMNNMAATDVASRLQNDGTVKFDIWATVQVGAGAYHADHVHENVFVSGVYYSAVPEGSAPLVLHRPLKIDGEEYDQNDVKEENDDDDDSKCIIYPKEGQVVLFPPWLLHGVPPIGKSTSLNSPRVSFAFNVSGYTFGDPWDVTRK